MPQAGPVSSGTSSGQPPPPHWAPSASPPSRPYACCLLSQPSLALFPLTLTLALSHDLSHFQAGHAHSLPPPPAPPMIPGQHLQARVLLPGDQCAHPAVGPPAQNWVHQTARSVAAAGTCHSRPRCGGGQCAECSHLLVLGCSGPSLVPPQVLGIFRCPPFLNLLVIKKQMKE